MAVVVCVCVISESPSLLVVNCLCMLQGKKHAEGVKMSDLTVLLLVFLVIEHTETKTTCRLAVK